MVVSTVPAASRRSNRCFLTLNCFCLLRKVMRKYIALGETKSIYIHSQVYHMIYLGCFVYPTCTYLAGAVCSVAVFFKNRISSRFDSLIVCQNFPISCPTRSPNACLRGTLGRELRGKSRGRWKLYVGLLRCNSSKDDIPSKVGEPICTGYLHNTPRPWAN